MSASIKINEEATVIDHLYCWKCRTTEVEVNATDSIYRLQCNKCYKYMKEKWTVVWVGSRENELVGCQFCWDAYQFKKKTEVHKCPMVGVYQCGVCAYQLNSLKSLKVHVKFAHGKKESSKIPFECRICKKVFSKPVELKTHLRTHTGERPFKCTICEKAFSQAGNLVVHLRTHTGEKPFECKICKKTFSRTEHVKFHLATHTGEKPFECNICKKAFSRRMFLIKHLRIHANEKPFECGICKKAFSRTDHAKLHFRTHTGEKPFECTICKKVFSHSWILKRHLNTHVEKNQENILF